MTFSALMGSWLPRACGPTPSPYPLVLRHEIEGGIPVNEAASLQLASWQAMGSPMARRERSSQNVSH